MPVRKQSGTKTESDSDERDAAREVVDDEPVDVIDVAKKNEASCDERTDREYHCQPKDPLRRRDRPARGRRGPRRKITGTRRLQQRLPHIAAQTTIRARMELAVFRCEHATRPGPLNATQYTFGTSGAVRAM